jgi:hypothetical protein
MSSSSSSSNAALQAEAATAVQPAAAAAAPSPLFTLIYVVRCCTYRDLVALTVFLSLKYSIPPVKKILSCLSIINSCCIYPQLLVHNEQLLHLHLA